MKTTRQQHCRGRPVGSHAVAEIPEQLQAEVRAFLKANIDKSPKPGGGRQRPNQKVLDWRKHDHRKGLLRPSRSPGIWRRRPAARRDGAGHHRRRVLQGRRLSRHHATRASRMLVPTLLEVGTKEQCAEWIEPTIRGEIIWCQGYSEPGSGSRSRRREDARARSRTATSSSTARRSGPAPRTTPT